MFSHLLRHSLAPLVLLLLLGGCASFSPDGGMLAVNEITAPALGGQAEAIRTPEHAEDARLRVKALLRPPLSADRAVRVAILNNRELQAAYNALALSDAARVQASLPPNPTFSLERIAGAGAVEIEGRIVGSILQLVTLPARAEIATDRYRQAQLRAASETLGIATQARRAFYRAVAAAALANHLEQATETGKTAAELARRLGETGAMNKLDQARAECAPCRTGGATRHGAPARHCGARAACARAGSLGIRSRISPAAAVAADAAAARATSRTSNARRWLRRLDLQIARIEADTLAKSYGLTNATRFINLLDAAGIAKKQSENGEITRERGFEVEVADPDLRLRRGERPAGGGELHAGRQPADREGRERPLRGARSLSQPTEPRTTSRSTTAATCCRCARSSPTKRCCATTQCRSTCSRC